MATRMWELSSLLAACESDMLSALRGTEWEKFAHEAAVEAPDGVTPTNRDFWDQEIPEEMVLQAVRQMGPRTVFRSDNGHVYPRRFKETDIEVPLISVVEAHGGSAAEQMFEGGSLQERVNRAEPDGALR